MTRQLLTMTGSGVAVFSKTLTRGTSGAKGSQQWDGTGAESETAKGARQSGQERRAGNVNVVDGKGRAGHGDDACAVQGEGLRSVRGSRVHDGPRNVVSYLKCDYDGTIPRDVWARLEMIARLHRLPVEWVRIDRTRHGYHMTIRIRRRVAMRRVILLQAVLGSDWKREAFNSARAWRANVPAFWRRRFNVLYSRHIRGVAL